MHPFTKEYDDDVGLVYMYQRWYCPETGTFLSKAPMPRWAEQPFGFSSASPVGLVDPAGMDDDGRTPLPDGWSYDNGIKKNECDNPSPANPGDWNERPHLNGPDGTKYYPGDKLPSKLPGKVRQKLDNAGFPYQRSGDPTFAPSLDDLNPLDNPLMWVPIAAGGAAIGAAAIGAEAGAAALGWFARAAGMGMGALAPTIALGSPRPPAEPHGPPDPCTLDGSCHQ